MFNYSGCCFCRAEVVDHTIFPLGYKTSMKFSQHRFFRNTAQDFLVGMSVVLLFLCKSLFGNDQH